LLLLLLLLFVVVVVVVVVVVDVVVVVVDVVDVVDRRSPCSVAVVVSRRIAYGFSATIISQTSFRAIRSFSIMVS